MFCVAVRAVGVAEGVALGEAAAGSFTVTFFAGV